MTKPAELDIYQLNDIWNRLTVGAKRTWVQAMQPADPDAWHCDECGVVIDESRRDEQGHEHSASCSLWVPVTPDLSDEPPVTADDLDRIVVEYVARVQRSGTRNAVLDAIRLDGHTPRGATEETGSRYDIASELAECATSMGITAPDVDGQPDEHDRYMDMLFDMLPAVDLRLRGDL